jgi:hypothetical protein
MSTVHLRFLSGPLSRAAHGPHTVDTCMLLAWTNQTQTRALACVSSATNIVLYAALREMHRRALPAFTTTTLLRLSKLPGQSHHLSGCALQSIDRRIMSYWEASIRTASGERTRRDHALCVRVARDLLRDCEECATEAKVRTKSNACIASVGRGRAGLQQVDYNAVTGS